MAPGSYNVVENINIYLDLKFASIWHKDGKKKIVKIIADVIAFADVIAKMLWLENFTVLAARVGKEFWKEGRN